MILIDVMDKAMEDAHLSSVDMDLLPHMNSTWNLNTNGRMMRPNQSGRRADDNVDNDNNKYGDDDNVERKRNVSQEKDANTNYLPDHSGSNSCSGSGSGSYDRFNQYKDNDKATHTNMNINQYPSERNQPSCIENG